jgi:integrase
MELALRKLHDSDKVNPLNKVHILKFLDHVETQDVGLPRRIRYLQNLTKLAAILGPTDFAKATKSDIESAVLQNSRLELAQDTKVLFKVMIKRFYRWLKDPNDEEYPAEVKWIKTTARNNHNIPPEQLLTEEDIVKLIAAAQRIRDKAFVSILYDLGGRIGEVLSLQRQDLSFDKYGAVAVVDGKTGRRRVRLILSVPFIAEWLSDHPDKQPTAPIWIHDHQGCHQTGTVQLDYYSARKLLIRLGKRAGLNKHVNPQIFRHSRATMLANHLTEAQLKEMFGWTQSSKMPGRYVHMSGRDVDDALLKVHGLEGRDAESEKPKLTIIKCARCEHANLSANKFCSKCSMPLKLEQALEVEQQRSQADEYMDKLLDDPEVRQIILTKLRKITQNESTKEANVIQP